MKKDYERGLVVLRENEYPGGGLKLVESELNCFMVLTRKGEQIEVEVFDDKYDAENCYNNRYASAACGGVLVLSGC